MSTLKGKQVAILVANGFEQVELSEPKRVLEESGAETRIVSPEDGEVKGWQHVEWGDAFTVDTPLEEADAASFDALVLPGGVMNPDTLRTNGKALAFVRAFFDEGKPVACICHGAWTLVESGHAKGRRMTSFHSIKTDVKNAGADWVDEKVVQDGNLITSRNPDDLPAFCEKLVQALA